MFTNWFDWCIMLVLINKGLTTMFNFNERYKKEVKEIEAMIRQLRFHNTRFQNHMREFGVCYLKKESVFNDIHTAFASDDSLTIGGDYELMVGKEAEFVKEHDFAMDVKKCVFSKYITLVSVYKDLRTLYNDADTAKGFFVNAVYGFRMPSKAVNGRYQYLLSLYDKLLVEFEILNSIVFKDCEIEL